MKFIRRDAKGKEEAVIVKWSDHENGCAQCRRVELGKSATFALACASPGAALLQEEIKRRQAPVVRKKRDEEIEWAKTHPEAFVVERADKDYVNSITRYVGDNTGQAPTD